MKALTLTEPWATLVMLGQKEWETRSWRTNYRGKLLIHAAKGFPKWAQSLIIEEPFRTALDGYGINRPFSLGYVLGVVWLVEVLPADSVKHLSEKEQAFGDYSPGRWAWQLTNPQWLVPAKTKGALGLWDCDTPLYERSTKPPKWSKDMRMLGGEKITR